jgi:hypothetical protein
LVTAIATLIESGGIQKVARENKKILTIMDKPAAAVLVASHRT